MRRNIPVAEELQNHRGINMNLTQKIVFIVGLIIGSFIGGIIGYIIPTDILGGLVVPFATLILCGMLTTILSGRFEIWIHKPEFW